MEKFGKDDNLKNELAIHELIKKTSAFNENEGEKIEHKMLHEMEKSMGIINNLEISLQKNESDCESLEKELGNLYDSFDKIQKIYDEKFKDVPDDEFDWEAEEKILKSINELNEKIKKTETLVKNVYEKLGAIKEKISKIEQRWENLNSLLSEKKLSNKIKEN